MTPLQYLAPDMARDGLIKNKDWVPAACEAALRVFAEPDLIVSATFVAALQPTAIDYIIQAPALVVAMTAGRHLAIRKDRLSIADRFIVLCRDRPRLKVIMKAYGLAPQLRRLDGRVLSRDDRDLLGRLSRIPPSRLAQIIPAEPERQAAWLAATRLWVKHMRALGRADLLIGWAASHLKEPGRALDDMVAFVAATEGVFQHRWSLAQAYAARDRHDARIARRAAARRAPVPSGVIERPRTPSEPTIPQMNIDGFAFIELLDTEQLVIEGLEMHHCLGSYGNALRIGFSRIVSIRQDERPVATLELNRDYSVPLALGYRYFVRQLKGPCNEPAGLAVERAVEAFLAVINLPFQQAAEREASARAEADRNEARTRIIAVLTQRSRSLPD